MPIGASAGTLDIENATLRSNAIVVLTNLVTGNDAVRSLDPPNLEVYGDPSQGGTEPTLELVSNVDAGSASAFTRLTSNAGVFSIQSGTDDTLDSKGDIVFSSIGGDSEHMRIVGSTGRVVIGNVDVSANLHMTTASSVLVDSNVVTEYTGPHDRPLRKYPEVLIVDVTPTSPINATSPFMGKSQSWGGYTTIYSSRFSESGNHNGIRAYDGILNTENPWMSAAGTYSTSDGSATSSDTFQSTNGSYITLSLPNKIRLSHICIYNRDSSSTRPPKDGIIWGSSDGGTTFNQIHTFSNLDPTRAMKHTLHITSTIKYDTVVVQITGMTIINSLDAVAIQELELYGYEEGSGSIDTTLKSVYNVPATTGTQLEVYYDAKDLATMPATVSDLSPNSNGGSVSGDPQVSNGAFVFDGVGDAIVSSGTSTSLDGNAIFSISLWSKTNTVSSGSNALFMLGYSSTNKSTGVRIHASTGNYRFFTTGGAAKTSPTTALLNEWTHITLVHEGTSGYKFYVNGVFTDEITVDNDLSLDSNPRVAIGNYIDAAGVVTGTASYDGSIANFRLYSKVLNADQVKELYDYQKDYFLGSKSQVTLYKGNLGVGVTEPSGQLELAGDERIQEYPPRGLTNFDTHIEGHGVFTASASSDYNGTQLAWHAFEKTSTYWWTNNDTNSPETYDITTGLYNGTQRLFEEAPLGEYIILKLPYSINLKSFTIESRSGFEKRVPKNGVVYGCRNNTWESVHSFSGLTYTTAEKKNINVNSNEYYDAFALVTTALAENSDNATFHNINISELRYFGTPGPTTLDKGSLSLTRSLDVPRVSRYDVDTETPRPEKLVVDFDTTVNESPTDISGKGNHGVMLSGASYSTADKAFDFNATSDTADTDGPSGSDPWGSIETTVPQLNGAQEITFSGWFKLDAIGVFQILYLLGRVTRTQDNNHMHWFAVSENGTLRAVVSGGAHINVYYTNTVLVANRWYHISYSIPSGTTVARNDVKVYLDGVEQVSTSSTGSASAIDIGDTGDAKLYLGWQESSTNYFAGRVSNFKIYNAFLEPSEVKKLYNLGRTGRSMVISDTAVGIGKVPEAQLDVRGTANFAGYVGIGTTNPSAQLHISSGNSGDCVLKIEADEDNNKEVDNPRIEFITDGGYNTALVGAGQMPFETSNDNALVLAAKQMKFYTGSVQDFTDSASMTERIRILSGGNVGIGTTNPACALHIVHGIDGGGTKDLDSQFNCAITSQRDDGTNRWMHGINGTDDYLFWYDANGSGIATCKAFFDHDGSDSVDQNFTGQHRTFIKDTPFVRAVELEGLIVSADNNKYIKMTGGIEVGSNAITTNESLPLVSLSTTTNDKKCFGVISASEDPETRENRFGNIVSVSQKELGDTRVYINSVGEGAMWVVNTAGPLESGDYITTSNVVGYGQKQDIEFLANYTVAKITMDCDFEPATQPIQIIKKELANVNYWVKTTYENVTEEEYSNLTEENRQIVDGVYQKITKEESKTEQEGYELEVRQELVNVLDEHGQIQWEDDPSGATEKAYKIRYLDANGNITDEANHVYKAAFVGCTYHCG
jgi:hypothetical protein